MNFFLFILKKVPVPWFPLASITTNLFFPLLIHNVKVLNICCMDKLVTHMTILIRFLKQYSGMVLIPFAT